MNNKLDCFKRNINVGDFVLYPLSKQRFQVGKVERFGAIKIYIINEFSQYYSGFKYAEDLCIINENEYKIFYDKVILLNKN